MAGTRGAGQAALREAAGGEEEKAGGAEGERGQETSCRGGEEEAEAGRRQGPITVARFTVSLLIEFSAIPPVLAFLNVGVFVTEGSARGGDAADGGQEPESQAKAQSLVLGRFSAAQHSQHSSRYLVFSDV